MSVELETLAEYVATRTRYDKFEALAKGAASPDPATRNEAAVAARKAAAALERLQTIEDTHPDIRQVAARVSAALKGEQPRAPSPQGTTFFDLFDRFGTVVATELASEMTGSARTETLPRKQFRVRARPAADRMLCFEVTMRQEDAAFSGRRAAVLNALERKMTGED